MKIHKTRENDIDERTRELTAANRQLRREKEVAQQYLDIAGVMMVVINADHTVALINKKGCDILGYSCSEVSGKKWFDTFVPERLRAEVKKVFEKLISGELAPAEYYENPVLTKNGEERLIAWHNALIKDEDGKIVSTLSSGQDITERRQAQEMLIQNEKMITVGSLAAGMAHEINNPLAGILQGIQVIQDRMSSNLAANQKTAEECGVSLEAVNTYLLRRNIPELLSAVKEAGERAAAIVENMLSFCRKSEASFSLQDIGLLLDKTIALAENEYDLKKKFDFRQIKITREYTPGLPPVPCEAIEIQQVILNLLKNAAQALSQAKRQVPCITLRTIQEKHMIRIEVEDNGPGMTEEIRRRIFEPFFTTKGVGQGTGLGLSVSHFIITENHGGSIDVKSVPGGGTTFFIRLPLHRKRMEKIK
ncbi:MAG: ATP-binding protein [Candidatus Aminicenantes bacterium]|nr:ATP-binding protein [Candidatus Aminicenantes bacterium]